MVKGDHFWQKNLKNVVSQCFRRVTGMHKYQGSHSDSGSSVLEAVVQGCTVKKVFSKIPQNSQENTCARVSLLIKLQASGQNCSKLIWFDKIKYLFQGTRTIQNKCKQRGVQQQKNWHGRRKNTRLLWENLKQRPKETPNSRKCFWKWCVNFPRIVFFPYIFKKIGGYTTKFWKVFYIHFKF